MNFDALLSLLDIDSPDELVYFEQFADLMETGNDIPVETLAALAAEMEPAVLAELAEGYFEDIAKYIPDGEDELYTLLTNIGTTLEALAGGSGGRDGDPRVFAEELYKFRAWYIFDSCVLRTDREDGSVFELPLFAALTDLRVQNFTEDDYEFDFSEALDYQLDEYIVSLNALTENTEYAEDTDD